jgi:hypothetical protein
LNFVIAGAGATVVELAGAIAEIVRRALKDDFRSIHPEEAQVVRSVWMKAPLKRDLVALQADVSSKRQQLEATVASEPVTAPS